MASRTLLPPSSGAARKASKVLTRAVRKQPHHKSARRMRKAKDAFEISLPLLAALGFGAFVIYTIRKKG